MTSSHETPASRPTTAIRDQRKAPRGVLPRQVQMWLMIGLAVLILAIILVTGRTTPLPRGATVGRPADPSALAPERIQAYRQQLTEDEARLRRELAQASTPPTVVAHGSAEPRPREVPQANPLVDEQRRRDYQSLFADNVAFSRRRVDPGFGGPLNRAALGPSPALALASAPPRSEPTAGDAAARKTPGGGDVLPSRTPSDDQMMPTRQGLPERPAAPNETGPIRSTDLRERLLEGTVIETVLINRLNGAFAGPVECLVTTPVYSHDRQRVVIPAGARVLGAASPVQTWGDSRLAVSFHRLVMPDGSTHSLDQFKGLDQLGETGLRDLVNRHYLQVFGASVAIGALSGLAQYGTVGGSGTASFSDEYRQAAGASLAASTGRVLDRYLNVLPTITIREGYRIKVYLTNDLELPALAGPAGGLQ